MKRSPCKGSIGHNGMESESKGRGYDISGHIVVDEMAESITREGEEDDSTDLQSHDSRTLA